MPADDEMLDTVAKAVAAGKCILFLGAGVHCAPPQPPPPNGTPYVYPDCDRPPLGSDFSLHLAEKSGFQQQFPNESARNLQRVALHYETTYSRRALVDEIRIAVYDGKRPSAVLRGLAHLDFPLVITTNYDQLYEDALRQASKRPARGVYKPNETEPADDLRDDRPVPNEPFVFKIHGDVEKPESIVITDEDYIQFVHAYER